MQFSHEKLKVYQAVRIWLEGVNEVWNKVGTRSQKETANVD